MSKLMFKRISTTPLPPTPPKKTYTVPSDPGEAYRAGLEAGKEFLEQSKAPKPVPTSKASDSAIVLFKPSDTGIGFKRWAVWIEDDPNGGANLVTEWGHESKHQVRKSKRYSMRARAAMEMRNVVQLKKRKGYRSTK